MKHAGLSGPIVELAPVSGTGCTPVSAGPPPRLSHYPSHTCFLILDRIDDLRQRGLPQSAAVLEKCESPRVTGRRMLPWPSP